MVNYLRRLRTFALFSLFCSYSFSQSTCATEQRSSGSQVAYVAAVQAPTVNTRAQQAFLVDSGAH